MKRIALVVLMVLAFAGPALAAKVVETKAVDSEADWTKMLELKGTFNVSIVSSSFVGTISLQRSFDKGATWKTVDTWVSNSTEEWKFEPEGGVVYRLGCDTGNYTSGDAAIRISQ